MEGLEGDSQIHGCFKEVGFVISTCIFIGSSRLLVKMCNSPVSWIGGTRVWCLRKHLVCSATMQEQQTEINSPKGLACVDGLKWFE